MCPLAPLGAYIFLSFFPPANRSNGLLHSSHAHILAPQTLYVILKRLTSPLHVRRPWVRPRSQSEWLHVERLVVDVYVGTHLVTGNLHDVYICFPNGPLRFTLCHQTFSLSLSGTPMLQSQDLSNSPAPPHFLRRLTLIPYALIKRLLCNLILFTLPRAFYND